MRLTAFAAVPAVVAFPALALAHGEPTTLTFPHTLEIGGSLTNTPLGTITFPYQSTESETDITFEEGESPVAFEYAYDGEAAFTVSTVIDGVGEGSSFSFFLRQGHGDSTEDSEVPDQWLLTMHYQPVFLIGGTEYTLPDNELLTFVRPHADPQPLPTPEGGEDLRHGTPVVLLIDSPITLFENGVRGSNSFVTIDADSRIVISEPVPSPASAGLAVLGLAVVSGRRRR